MKYRMSFYKKMILNFDANEKILERVWWDMLKHMRL